MTVKENIAAGKYAPVLPFVGQAPQIGDYKHLAIAKVDVYPPGHDPFAELKPGQQRIKPTQEYYLDVLTENGTAKYRVDIKDRIAGEALIKAEVERARVQLSQDIAAELNTADLPKHEGLFAMAWANALYGMNRVVDRYAELAILIK